MRQNVRQRTNRRRLTCFIPAIIYRVTRPAHGCRRVAPRMKGWRSLLPDLMPLMPEHFRCSNLAYRLEVHPKGEHRGTDSRKFVRHQRRSRAADAVAAENASDAPTEGIVLVL
ncbi:hypothetical protein ACFFTM_17920 [Pseudoduganella plicata]|uniref:hypothetical protein n=1 Tax=Pseudoduganella plicata TaxID=321984 RepID=UPI00141AA185|nr:hypothetical protein [Pseudoduganella plicata]